MGLKDGSIDPFDEDDRRQITIHVPTTRDVSVHIRGDVLKEYLDLRDEVEAVGVDDVRVQDVLEAVLHLDSVTPEDVADILHDKEVGDD